jgi:hypothetical protein
MFDTTTDLDACHILLFVRSYELQRNGERPACTPIRPVRGSLRAERHAAVMPPARPAGPGGSAHD